MATDTAPAETDPAESEQEGQYVEPVVDVAALTALLDGTYAEQRDVVRRALAEHAGDPGRRRDDEP